MSPWFELPADLDPNRRARLTVARLAADGLWAATATGVFPPDPHDHDAVTALNRSLTTESALRRPAAPWHATSVPIGNVAGSHEDIPA